MNFWQPQLPFFLFIFYCKCNRISPPVCYINSGVLEYSTFMIFFKSECCTFSNWHGFLIFGYTSSFDDRAPFFRKKKIRYVFVSLITLVLIHVYYMPENETKFNWIICNNRNCNHFKGDQSASSYPVIFGGLLFWYSTSSTVQTAPLTFSTRTKHLCRLRLWRTAFWVTATGHREDKRAKRSRQFPVPAMTQRSRYLKQNRDRVAVIAGNAIIARPDINSP